MKRKRQVEKLGKRVRTLMSRAHGITSQTRKHVKKGYHAPSKKGKRERKSGVPKQKKGKRGLPKLPY